MLRHLNNQEMIAITSTWSSNPDARATFLSISEIAPLHPKVVKIDAELLAVQPEDEVTSAATKKLVAATFKVDVVHDSNVRAMSACIEADRMVSLAAQPPLHARAELGVAIHAKLLPMGLSIVNASYLAESGNATRVAALLEQDPAIGEFLGSIPIRGKLSVLDLTKRWVTAGKKLGKLEHERSVLFAKDAAKLGFTPFPAVRGRWLRLVSQVLSALELSDAPPDAIEIIRGPVRLASERAARRYAEAPGVMASAVPTLPEAAPLALVSASNT